MKKDKEKGKGREYITQFIKRVQGRINTQIVLRRALDGLCAGLFLACVLEAVAVFKPF